MPRKKHRLSSLYEGPPIEDDCVVSYQIDTEEPPGVERSIFEEGLAADDNAVDDEFAPPDEPLTIEGEPALVHETKAADANETSATDAERSQDQVMEVICICTSCTNMLFTECEGPCPYSFVSLMGSDHDSYSWLLHTTCLSCVKKHKSDSVNREHFGNECMAAFASAMLSEDFMKRTSWFETAGRVCRKPVKILMDELRRSVAYVKIDDVREETTDRCKMRGLKSSGSGDMKSSSIEIVEPFMPGGFV